MGDFSNLLFIFRRQTVQMIFKVIKEINFFTTPSTYYTNGLNVHCILRRLLIRHVWQGKFLIKPYRHGQASWEFAFLSGWYFLRYLLMSALLWLVIKSARNCQII